MLSWEGGLMACYNSALKCTTGCIWLGLCVYLVDTPIRGFMTFPLQIAVLMTLITLLYLALIAYMIYARDQVMHVQDL